MCHGKTALRQKSTHYVIHTCTAVLLPLPLLPTRATVFPAGILRLNPLGKELECGGSVKMRMIEIVRLPYHPNYVTDIHTLNTRVQMTAFSHSTPGT